MIHSIRRFLLISLLIAITIASSITAIGNYLLDKKVIQPYLDKHLTDIAAFIIASHFPSKNIEETLQHIPKSISNHLTFQVWDNHNTLLYESTHGTKNIFQDSPLGFSDKEIKNNDWRIYTVFDQRTQLKVIVAESHGTRNQLANDITKNNAYILLIAYPIFGFLIWLIVGLALRSITRVSADISNRASTYLEPVDTEHAPIEIKPMLDELNHLFVRLRAAFERNRRFAADAAHELRTPLAALKTQAQVALKTDNENDRDNALMKVIQGVDRSSHVVAQLLTLSRLGQEEALNDIKPLDLHKLAAEIIALLAPIALEKNIDIELAPPPKNSILLGNHIALGILIRNLVDNAIRYTPHQGAVRVHIFNQQDQLVLRVIDSGPGIPAELRERVFERFFRILGTTVPGSGLGLAIVSQIAELHQATIKLDVPENGMGLQVDVIFPQR